MRAVPTVLAAILVLIPLNFVHAQILTAEREALVALYNSTDGAKWSDNNSWLGPVGPECLWYGVDCSGGHVEELSLSNNNLNGVIPAELGNLSSLLFLWLNSNRLSGDIPAELGDLSALGNGAGLDLRWNALHSDNATLVFFLNAKQRDGYDWQSTQTIPPENPSVVRVGDHTVWLSWDAVSCQFDTGGYSTFSAPTGTGIWTPGGWTEGKDVVTFPVTGLNPGTPYDFAVISYTDPHADNLNLVNSDFSPEVMATTASGGCAQPVIEIEWGSPITLSLSASYESYLWITGETTPTIGIAPLFDQWYWVTVTSAGPCEEAASIWVDPSTLIFLDGFESGDTGAWSVLASRCGELTEEQCMISAECTFTSEYTCRPAEGPCESGFRQGIDSAESCEAKENCSYDPGFCYCPPGMWCWCGGGPPPGCWDS